MEDWKEDWENGGRMEERKKGGGEEIAEKEWKKGKERREDGRKGRKMEGVKEEEGTMEDVEGRGEVRK